MPYDIENLVKSSIGEYNNNQKKFFEKLKEQYSETDIKEIKYDFKRQLDANFRVFMNDEIKKKQAIDKLQLENYSKKKHQDIATDFLINKGDIEKFYINHFFNEIYQSSDVEILEKNILKFIKENYFDDEKKFNYLKSVVSKIISLFSPYILKGGNDQNFALLEIGINNSNQGDGAEHIFVAKAMIAGFNASKVDVGSSDYDDAKKVSKAVEILHKNHPDLIVDGPIQSDFALNREMLKNRFPFSILNGRKVNTLIFPNLDHSITYK